MDERERLLNLANLAEQTGRYCDMKDTMRKLVQQPEVTELTDEERNGLLTAYKNLLGSLRISWEVLDFAEKKVESDFRKGKDIIQGLSLEQRLTVAQKYKSEISKELIDLCGELIALLDQNLLPSAKSYKDKVVYLKTMGDYYRYMVQIADDDQTSDLSEKSSQSYEKANEIADTHLEAIDSTRLGLALNISVFYYEVEKNPKKACLHAKKAFEVAIENLENITRNSKAYKESTHIMQLLRDNLALWRKDLQDDNESNQED